MVTEKTTNEGRARLYGFLAALFCTPPTEQSRHALLELTRVLDIDGPRQSPVEQLEREFMDLFIVPNARYVAPYESAYRDAWPIPPGLAAPGPDGSARTMKRLLMGESTAAVRECFSQARVEPTDGLPDHISNELQLMSYLWSGEAQQSCGGNGHSAGLRSTLREDHLLKWVADLRSKVTENESSGFYSAGLRVVELLLDNDADGDVFECSRSHS